MTAFDKLLIVYEMMLQALELEEDLLIRDQLAQEKFAKTSKNKAAVEMAQVKINERFDNYEDKKAIVMALPELVERVILESKYPLELRIRELDDLITQMGRFEISLIKKHLVRSAALKHHLKLQQKQFA